MKKTGIMLLLILWSASGAFIGPCHAQEAENYVEAIYLSEKGQQLAVQFDLASETVTMDLPDGETITLTASMSASGARYSDGKMTFWEHQGSATLDKSEKVLFEGKEIPLATSTILAENDPMREAVAQYSDKLKQTDDNFKNDGPMASFEAQLDAGEGKEPILASCSNIISSVRYHGDWASVEFVMMPVEEQYKKLPIMADGTMYFLMKKDKDGKWQGCDWFLGSISPCLTKKKIEESGISAVDMISIGWMVEPE